MELAKVHIGSKYGHLRFQPWYREEISSEFIVKPDYYDCETVWYHEFTEESIWYTLQDVIGVSEDILKTQIMNLLSYGVKEAHLPCHVIASLHGLSYYHGKLIDSCTYARLLPFRYRCPS